MCKRLIHLLSFVLVSGLVMTSVAGAADTSLVGWWKFDESTGTSANDSSGKGNNGALRGDAKLVAQGHFGGAILLDGNGDYVDCGRSDIFNIRSAITLTAWVWADPDFAYPDWSGIIMRGGPNTDTFAIYYYRPGNRIGFKTTGTTPNWLSSAVGAAAGLFDKEWHHVAGTYDGATQIIYLDGTVLVNAAASGQIETSSGRLLLGAGRDQDPSTVCLAGRLDDARIYSRALSAAEIQTVMKGGEAGLSSNPSPGNNATDVPRDAVLGWKPGEFAKTHDVYLGTVFADVNTASRTGQKGVLASQGQDTNTYDPSGFLALGQTYYWRVDEVNAPPNSTIYKGEVWSFTAEPVGFAIKPIAATASSSQNIDMVPGKTIEGSGLNASDQHGTLDTTMWLSSITGPQPTWIQYEFDKVYKLHKMWVWNANTALEAIFGFGAKDVTVQYSTDAATWTALAGVSQFTRATGTAGYAHNTTVDFGGVAVKYAKITIKNNWGGILPQYGLSEVRFFQIPVRVRMPQPASAATNVTLDRVLSWRTGREAARHEVFFGTDPNVVRDATIPVQTVTEASCSLASLAAEYGRTYYWKVNEVNDAATPTSWNGDVWSFSTAGYAVVDNFEAYDDTCNRIFFAWVDGLGHSGSVDCGIAPSGGNGTGSAVGNMQQPFAERTIFQSGGQSMPMAYDNSMGKLYSETQREWTDPQVWSTGGANTLVVYLRGVAPAFLETSPGNILMNGMGTDIWGTADQGRFTYKQLSGDGSITARIDSLANTNAWAKAGVMIRETLDVGSTHAMVVVSSSSGVAFQRRLLAAGASTTTTTVAPQPGAPYWVKVTRTGSTFTAKRSTDGVTWMDITSDPAASSATITMANDVYIGLAVTSHAANVVCGARFSSVSTTGKVTGAWQQADLGVAQSTVAGNAPEAFYVAVEDSAKHLKVVSNTDPILISTGAWELWQIPFSTFTSAGVNLSAVKKVYIGVGDRNSPKTGGAGKVYIDDIRVTRIATP